MNCFNILFSILATFRLGYRQGWDKDFREYLKSLDKKKPVILCGDLNVAHKEIGACAKMAAIVFVVFKTWMVLLKTNAIVRRFGVFGLKTAKLRTLSCLSSFSCFLVM